MLPSRLREGQETAAAPLQALSSCVSHVAESNLKIHFLGHERVDAALDFVEPCPPSRPLVLALGRFDRARRAPNRAIALIYQRIVGNLVLPQIIPNRLPAPIRHRNHV